MAGASPTPAWNPLEAGSTGQKEDNILRFPFPLSLAGLAALVAFALAGSAFAHTSVRPDRPVSIQAMRAVVHHSPSPTWTYERAAHVPLTPTSFSYRRTTDPSYLQWSIDTWTARSYHAREQALAGIRRSLSVALPQ